MWTPLKIHALVGKSRCFFVIHLLSTIYAYNSYTFVEFTAIASANVDVFNKSSVTLYNNN